MTALAGLVGIDDRPELAFRCAAMLDAQAAHAPGGTRLWCEDGAALGRRLFATLPEDRLDLGPQRLGPYVLVGDIRLDDREALAAALAIPSFEASHLCDSALALHAYARWGEAGVVRLLGDFAIAIWDANRRRLLLARDFLGQRPLHYRCSGDGIAFASMPKGLHALPGVAREPDLGNVARFLARLPEQGSFFAGIATVPPAHYLTWTGGKIAIERYWWPPTRHAPPPCRAGEVHAAFRDLLDRSVAARLRGGGSRLGAQLSGGLDSGAVTATAARMMGPAQGLVAYTSVPSRDYVSRHPDRLDDERELAALTAGLYPNIAHALIADRGVSPFDRLDRALDLNERPLPNLANHVWISAIMDAARSEGVTVLLTGAAGNLTFSYSGSDALADLFAARQWRRLAGLTRHLHRQGRGFAGLARQTLRPILRRQQLGIDVLLHPEARREIMRSARDRVARRSDSIARRAEALRATDIGNFGKGWLGGWGIDVRDPSADRRIVDFTLALPVEHFLSEGTPRALARIGLADRLPASVLTERRRGHQAAGWHRAFVANRDALREAAAASVCCPRTSSVIDTRRLQAHIEQWPADWGDRTSEAFYRTRVLPALGAALFIREASREVA